MTSWLDERYLKKGILEEREYQTGIADIATEQSTLVVLPTGMGKTIVATILISRKLDEGNVLFLAPTKPLAHQHYVFLCQTLTLPDDDIVFFTGETSPSKRAGLWGKGRIIISTPQVVENDVISGTKNLGDISLLIFDEAHRAVGKYAYSFIGEKYRDQSGDGLVLGMTASPGADPQRIREVCENLGIQRIELRSKWDRDVSPYVHEIRMGWVEVELPEQLKNVRKHLEEICNRKISSLRKMGLVRGRNVGVGQLLDAQRIILARLHAEGKQAPKYLYQALSIQAQAMKINHALGLLTTQDMTVLSDYLDKLRAESRTKGSSRASRTLVEDPSFKYAAALTKLGDWTHPKIPKTREVVRVQLLAKEDSRIILFTQYRGTARKLLSILEDVPEARAAKFVGQRTTESDKGLSQKEQFEVLRMFREGEINVLVATSVAEEGLDIPSTDLVIFYEPVPSEIRTIQRRGRTGRQRMGRVIILITKGTRDEAYYWTARNKEKRMRREIVALKREFHGGFIAIGDGSEHGSSSQRRIVYAKDNERNEDERMPRKDRMEKGGVGVRPAAVVEPDGTNDVGGEQNKIDIVDTGMTNSPSCGIPHGKHISADHPSAVRPSADHASAVHPSADFPSVARPSADHASAVHPSANRPFENHPSTACPSADPPSTVLPSAGIPFGDRHRLVAGEKGKQIPAFPRMKPTDSSVGDSSADSPDNSDPSGESKERKASGENRAENWDRAQTSLGDFSREEPLIIYVDTREFNSEVVRHLSRMGVLVRSKQLDIADYVLSDRVAVERKEVRDFLSSLLDGYLFTQLKRLKAYQSPLLVIEGDGLFTTRNVSDEAIFGSLSAISISLGISVIMSRDAHDTARLLVASVKRERSKGRVVRLRSDKATMGIRERQQYILEGLPHISAKLAIRLLSHFGTVGAVFEAGEEELRKVKGIGKTVAGDIRKAIDAAYKL